MFSYNTSVNVIPSFKAYELLQNCIAQAYYINNVVFTLNVRI